LIYTNPNSGASSGSLYVTPRSIGTSPAPVVTFLTASGAPVAQIRLRPDARIDLVDSHGSRVDISNTSWLPDHTTRVDWCQVTTDTSTTVTVWIYIGLNIEAW